MLSNNQQKYLRSLTQKKFRDKYGVFTVEGEKIVGEVLREGQIQVKNIFGLSEWFDQYGDLIKERPHIFTAITEKELRQISNFSTPNQVFAVLEQPQKTYDTAKLKNNYAIYLDNLQDPGNLGTIWRIADWFGFPYIFCSKGCVDWTNPKVVQASMGAFLRVPIIQQEFESLQNELPTLPTYAAVLGGENIFEHSFSKNGLLIIGNESKGIGATLQAAATHTIAIPKGKNGGAESLNAAVATGIICGQISRFIE